MLWRYFYLRKLQPFGDFDELWHWVPRMCAKNPESTYGKVFLGPSNILTKHYDKWPIEFVGLLINACFQEGNQIERAQVFWMDCDYIFWIEPTPICVSNKDIVPYFRYFWMALKTMWNPFLASISWQFRTGKPMEWKGETYCQQHIKLVPVSDNYPPVF